MSWLNDIVAGKKKYLEQAQVLFREASYFVKKTVAKYTVKPIHERRQKSWVGAKGNFFFWGVGGGGDQKISWNFTADLWKSRGLAKKIPKNAKGRLSTPLESCMVKPVFKDCKKKWPWLSGKIAWGGSHNFRFYSIFINKCFEICLKGVLYYIYPPRIPPPPLCASMARLKLAVLGGWL